MPSIRTKKPVEIRVAFPVEEIDVAVARLETAAVAAGRRVRVVSPDESYSERVVRVWFGPTERALEGDIVVLPPKLVPSTPEWALRKCLTVCPAPTGCLGRDYPVRYCLWVPGRVKAIPHSAICVPLGRKAARDMFLAVGSLVKGLAEHGLACRLVSEYSFNRHIRSLPGAMMMPKRPASSVLSHVAGARGVAILDPTGVFGLKAAAALAANVPVVAFNVPPWRYCNCGKVDATSTQDDAWWEVDCANLKDLDESVGMLVASLTTRLETGSWTDSTTWPAPADLERGFDRFWTDLLDEAG